ncbi:MAG TPA: hypothetical protein VEH31_04875 [Streptosporangiaceae bacterium]|nr:hypothetical protein [Streptosporangiaceae bacterium]
MSHRPASSQPRLAGRHIPRIHRTLATLGALAAFLTAAIGLAPTASAVLPPPEPPAAPLPPPPPAAVPAHFPPWAIAAILAATIVLSVATTLITLALEHTRWARREAAAIPESQASMRSPVTTPAHQAEILRRHPTHDRA